MVEKFEEYPSVDCAHHHVTPWGYNTFAFKGNTLFIWKYFLPEYYINQNIKRITKIEDKEQSNTTFRRSKAMTKERRKTNFLPGLTKYLNRDLS